MHEKYIIYEPFQGNNAYIENMKRCWGKLYKVISLTSAESNMRVLLDTKAIVLNWIEGNMTFQKKRQLIWFKLIGIKIIWVFHNRIPHDLFEDTLKLKTARENMRFMTEVSDGIILHSRSSRKYLKEYTNKLQRAFYIPHVDYMYQSGWIEEKKRKNAGIFTFVFQGRIAPYKNIELLINVFKDLKLPACRLYIAGKPSSTDYEKKIRQLCESTDIHLKLEFLSDYEVGSEIQRGDVMVLPYDLKSSMNSGAMISAFTNKRTVIIANNAMAQDYKDEGFLYVYDYVNQQDHYKQLKRVMQEAYEKGAVLNREKGEMAFQYTRKHNNDYAVAQRLRNMMKNI